MEHTTTTTIKTETKEPTGYISQKELIRQKLLASGSPEDVFKTSWASFQYLTEFGFSASNYSNDWKQWKAESRLWQYYFSAETFPGIEPDPAIVVDTSSSRGTTDTKTCPEPDIVQDPLQNLPKDDNSRGASEVMNITKPSSSGDPAIAGPRYASRVHVIRAKAFACGHPMSYFEAALTERCNIARERFPSESTDWQQWWAESSLWRSLFKGSPFPGTEPVRLFPLRSNTETMAPKKPVSPGPTWERLPNTSSDRYRPGEYYRPSTELKGNRDRGNTATDSYRPSMVGNGKRDRSADRQTMVDSYRPSAAGNRDRSMDRNATYRDTSRKETTTPSKKIRETPTILPSHSPSKTKASTVTNMPTSNKSDYSGSSTKRTLANPQVLFPIQPILIQPVQLCPQNMPDSTKLPSQEYQPLFTIMERKAEALNIRRPFFQCLNNKRLEAISKHGGCSNQYRHWYADSATWRQLFKDPFPGKEPVGPHIHSGLCSSSRMPVQVSERAISMLKAGNFGEYRRSGKISGICIVVNDQIGLYPADVGKAIFDAFLTITPATKRKLESELGCTILYHRFIVRGALEAGDIAFRSVPNVVHDTVSEEKGNQFLKKWLRETYTAVTTGLKPTLLDFHASNDPACQNDGGELRCHVMIEGKCSLFSSESVERICDSFSKDIAGRGEVEDWSRTYITLSSAGLHHFRVALTIKASAKWKDARDSTAAERKTYDFLRAWIQKITSIPPWAFETPSIREYWKEYGGSTKEDAGPRFSLLMNGSCYMEERCSQSSLRNLSYSFTIDSKKPAAEEFLQCRLTLSNSLDGEGFGGLNLVLTPFEDANENIQGTAIMLLRSWATQAFQEQPIKISKHLESSAGPNLREGESTPPTRHQTQPVGSVNIGGMVTQPLKAPNAITVSEVLPGDPETCWDRYAVAHNATDVDRLLIEEQVKHEGVLRMVRDEDTGDMVTLEEFAARTRLRVINNLSNVGRVGLTDKAEVSHLENNKPLGVHQKRKVSSDKDGGDETQKKARF